MIWGRNPTRIILTDSDFRFWLLVIFTGSSQISDIWLKNNTSQGMYTSTKESRLLLREYSMYKSKETPKIKHYYDFQFHFPLKQFLILSMSSTLDFGIQPMREVIMNVITYRSISGWVDGWGWVRFVNGLWCKGIQYRGGLGCGVYLGFQGRGT